MRLPTVARSVKNTFTQIDYDLESYRNLNARICISKSISLSISISTVEITGLINTKVVRCTLNFYVHST